MITQAKFASLYFNDQQRALEFFAETLGFELLTDAPMGTEGRWIEVRPPGAQTYLVLYPADPEARAALRERLGPMASVWFECDDLDATFADLKGKGVDFPVEPQAAPWNPNARWAQFSDPEGTFYGVSEREA